jgi:hypothetical protein
MGTNYYRIPSVEEMEKRKQELIDTINSLDIHPFSIQRNFRTIKKQIDSIDYYSIWDLFTDGTNIHLGKRSSGWKFLWNFNDKKFYSNKEELLNFIRIGRVIDEYGNEMDVEEFITMALVWGQPDGYDLKRYRQEHPRQYHYDFEVKEEYIDELRVSPNNEFS